MTKTQFNKITKGMFNRDMVVDGVKICRVVWKSNPWMIIENEETFEDASKNDFAPILAFRTRDELYDALYKSKYIKHA